VSGPELMTVAEVARQSRFSTKTVLRALQAGELVGSKVRSRWVIWPADFRAWIDAGRRTTSLPARPRPEAGGPVGSSDRLLAIERAA
jgi:excisionase family DNA binding protein